MNDTHNEHYTPANKLSDEGNVATLLSWKDSFQSVSGNKFITLESIVGVPVNAQMIPMISRKAWLTSGAGRSRLSLHHEMLLEWNRVEHKIGMEWHRNGMEIDQEICDQDIL